MSIGGVPWQVGQHCLYHAGPGGATHLGTVTTVYHGMDELMDDVVIFQVENKHITHKMGHYCLFSNDQRATVAWVSWKLVTWKCKILRVNNTDMALPYVSCSSHELMEFR